MQARPWGNTWSTSPTPRASSTTGNTKWFSKACNANGSSLNGQCGRARPHGTGRARPLRAREGYVIRKLLALFGIVALACASRGLIPVGRPDGNVASVEGAIPVDAPPVDLSRMDEAIDLPPPDNFQGTRGIDGAIGDGRNTTEGPESAGQGAVLCGVQYCTSATGPCCPSTGNMSRLSMCMLDCGIVPRIACDGPEDCSNGLVCCSVESVASGFAGASCAKVNDCVPPSRVICHQQTDCPFPQRCGVPNPLPKAVSSFAGPSSWQVDFLVCSQ